MSSEPGRQESLLPDPHEPGRQTQTQARQPVTPTPLPPPQAQEPAPTPPVRGPQPGTRPPDRRQTPQPGEPQPTGTQPPEPRPVPNPQPQPGESLVPTPPPTQEPHPTPQPGPEPTPAPAPSTPTGENPPVAPTTPRKPPPAPAHLPPRLGVPPTAPTEGGHPTPPTPTRVPRTAPVHTDDDVVAAGFIGSASGLFTTRSFANASVAQQEEMRKAGFFRRFWLHASEYGQKYKKAQEIRKAAVASGNPYTTLEMVKRGAADVTGAVTAKKEQEAVARRAEELLKSGLTAETQRYYRAKGAELEIIVNDLIKKVYDKDKRTALTAQDMNKELVEFAERHKDDERLRNFLDAITDKNDIFLAKQKGRTDVYAATDRFLQFVRQTGAKLDRNEIHLEDVQVIIGKPEWAQATESHATITDKAVHAVQKYVPLLTPASAAALSSVVVWGVTRYMPAAIKHFGGPIGWGAGTALGVGLAAVRANTEAKEDIAHYRAKQEFGGNPLLEHQARESGFVRERRERLEATRYDMATPEQLINGGGIILETQGTREPIASLEEKLRNPATTEQEKERVRRDLADRAGEIISRLNYVTALDKKERKGVIDFGDERNKEEKQLQLLRTADHILDLLVERNGRDDAGYKEAKRHYIDADVARWKEKLQKDIAEKDKKADEYRAMHRNRAMLTAAVTSIALAPLAHEVAQQFAQGVADIGTQHGNILAAAEQYGADWGRGIHHVGEALGQAPQAGGKVLSDMVPRDAVGAFAEAGKAVNNFFPPHGANLEEALQHAGKAINQLPQETERFFTDLGPRNLGDAGHVIGTEVHNLFAPSAGMEPILNPDQYHTVVDHGIRLNLPTGWGEHIKDNTITLTHGSDHYTLVVDSKGHIEGLNKLPPELQLTGHELTPAEPHIQTTDMGRLVIDQQTGVALRLPDGYNPIPGGIDLQHQTLTVRDVMHHTNVTFQIHQGTDGTVRLTSGQTTFIAHIQLPETDPSKLEAAWDQAWSANQANWEPQAAISNVVHEHFGQFQEETGQTA